MPKPDQKRFIPFDADNGDWYVLDTKTQAFASNHKIGYGFYPTNHEKCLKRCERLNEISKNSQLLLV